MKQYEPRSYIGCLICNEIFYDRKESESHDCQGKKKDMKPEIEIPKIFEPAHFSKLTNYFLYEIDKRLANRAQEVFEAWVRSEIEPFSKTLYNVDYMIILQPKKTTCLHRLLCFDPTYKKLDCTECKKEVRMNQETKMMEVVE